MSIESQDSEIGPVALELDDGDQRPAIIRLSGEFDTTNCAKIREIFAIALEIGCKALQLDMSEVSFIGSATLRELLTALRLAAEAQVQVKAVAVSPVTRRLLDLADLDLFNDRSQRRHPQAASRVVEGPAPPPYRYEAAVESP
jgi:anti-anti-sigma factor